MDAVSMPSIQLYHVYEATSRVGLICQVNLALLDGWQCQGGIVVCYDPATQALTPHFYQAMVRRHDTQPAP